MSSVYEYLKLLGVEPPKSVDLETLERLQYAHLVAVPLVNLSDSSEHLSLDQTAVVDKVICGGGGTSFELNAAFAWLLEQLGYSLRRLGAAILLNGPSVVIDHLTIEVQLDRPHLVDVGFADSFVRPLDLAASGTQDGGSAMFEFIQSPQGTTLTRHVGGYPEPQFRFKRVGHALSEFETASSRVISSPDVNGQLKPVITRLLGEGADRVTLTLDRLKLTRGGISTESNVASEEWDEVLWKWFALRS